jgi:hypothetical protein
MSQPIPEATANRLPLHATPLIPLDLGKVRASGWLANQLRLQAEGMTGHAEEVIPELGPDSAWRGGDGENWEKGPYYFRGLVSLALLHDDPALLAKAQSWVEAILAGQQQNGQIGPLSNPDWWPRMVVTWALRDYCEATGDPRIIPALLRYSRYLGDNLANQPLRDWARARAADQIDTLFWLYNRTQETFLLDVADTLREQANRWNEFFADLEVPEGDYRSVHAVNVSQAMKYPVVLYQRSGAESDRTIFGTGWRNLRARHGLAFGMWSGTEGLAGHADNQGVELCSMVEQILSNAMALKALADPDIGDEQERIAFNLLAGATTKDFRQHQYYSLPNMPVARRNRKGVLPFVDDHGDDLLLSPHAGFHCCCYNLHMGWPKYVQYAWMATSDGGLAAVAHGPTAVTASIGDATVTILAETDYPFEDTIRFRVTASALVEFPLLVRIPGWCAAPVIQINGAPVDGVVAGAFLRIARQWQTGDVVVAEFPADVSVTTGATEAKTVWRGPLAFSLRIEETAEIVTANADGFDEFELLPASPWNYALEQGASASAITAATQRRPMPANPWLPQTTPLRLTTAARRVPGWGLTAEDRLADTVPIGAVESVGPSETVDLVPCGTQTLRITAFPWTRSG